MKPTTISMILKCQSQKTTYYDSIHTKYLRYQIHTDINAYYKGDRLRSQEMESNSQCGMSFVGK